MPEPQDAELRALLEPFPPTASHGLTLYLRSVQARFNWIPPEALYLASEHFNQPYPRVYEAAAFTPGLSLEPRGRHVVKVCHGLACREAGSQDLLKEYSRLLGIRPEQMTPDGEFSLVSTPCLGHCAIGPNVVLDGVTAHGQGLADCGLSLQKLRRETA